MGDTQASLKPLHALPGPGSELGQYRIVELLGAGGMGQVFLAEHKRLGRRVALKLLLPQFAGNPEVIARFFHEAKSVNQINHAHIVEIMDFVEDPNGYNYFIMELLDGRDLATTREHDGPFTVERTVHIARQIASALTATHQKGIVHRDLKPENIFLIDRDGKRDFVKILDFGIAKLSAAELGDERPKTRAGMILGTPEYMSPEQAGGQVVDARSDLYALGIILYWMLSDELPFRGDSMGEVLVKQLTEPPPPLGTLSASKERIPDDLSKAVGALLQREPGKRPQTAAELVDRLKALDVTSTDWAPTSHHTQRKSRGLFAALGGVLLLVAIGAYLFGRGDKTASAGPQGGTVAQPAQPGSAPPLPALSPVPGAQPSQQPAAQSAVPVPPQPSKEQVSPKAKAEALKATAHPKPKTAAKKKASANDDTSGMIDPFAP